MNLSENKNIIVTGGAGFIGSHVVEFLLSKNYKVTVIDNFDSFYSRSIKEANLSNILSHPNATFLEQDILDESALATNLQEDYCAIIHLAAKAGVRPSIENPVAYQQVNIVGTQNMLEFARKKKIKQFLFASSSSVYGINANVPWKETDGLLKPISPYASSKISCELMGHVYSQLYGIRFLAMRFFTVFGPRQRPDLAIHKFSSHILKNEPIPFYGEGNTKRDYTFINDIVSGIYNTLNYTDSDYEIFNLGNNTAISLVEMLKTLEEVFDKKAIVKYLPEQQGDVSYTYADIEKAKTKINYSPQTTLRDGLLQFKLWYLKQA